MPVKRILLVEDNPDDEALTLRAFRRHRIADELVVARDGVEALDYLAGASKNGEGGQPDLPSVVLLDLKLPRIDGLEVLRRIRSDPATKTLPVVVLTSSRQDQDIASSYELGCNSYIRKPVDFDSFMEAVGTLGRYWLVLNEAPAASYSRA